jgi:hypothetical protein
MRFNPRIRAGSTVVHASRRLLYAPPELVECLQVIGKDLSRSLLDTANIRARKIHEGLAGADQAVEIV